jgi:hypothetical protein
VPYEVDGGESIRRRCGVREQSSASASEAFRFLFEYTGGAYAAAEEEEDPLAKALASSWVSNLRNFAYLNPLTISLHSLQVL